MQTLYKGPTPTPTVSRRHMPDLLERIDGPVEKYVAAFLPTERWAAQLAFEFAVSAVGFGREWDFIIDQAEGCQTWYVAITARRTPEEEAERDAAMRYAASTSIAVMAYPCHGIDPHSYDHLDNNF